MQRWLTRILICLLLGAVTTVAVAWGIVMFVVDTSPDPSMRFNDRVSDIDLGNREPKPHARFSIGANRGFGFYVGGMQVIYSFGEQVSPTEVGRMDEVAFVEVGWPLFAMQGLRSHGPHSLGWSHPTIKASNSREIVAPLRAIWPGFLIDTLFYAALWFGLFFGFGTGRRGLRKKRGLCPMCADDLRGCPAGSRASPRGCPECGWGRERA